jgi:phenylpyruvate tautomerase PptA (4-oxalocrotonate tautomerase family)
MPTLRIVTNVDVPAEDRAAFLTRASRGVAEMLGKPESYVMVILETGRDMLFAGTSAPTAYVELKSLGLAETKTTDYSGRLCDLLADALGIPGERTYIEFASPPRHLFGWNHATF